MHSNHRFPAFSMLSVFYSKTTHARRWAYLKTVKKRWTVLSEEQAQPQQPLGLLKFGYLI